MVVRTMVKIDEDKCNGCGLCVPSCAEGAIQIIDGKARLVADNLCDGLGACLGDCPEDAITVEERDADEFDEVAVEKHLKKVTPTRVQKPTVPLGVPAISELQVHPHAHAHGPGGGCPGSKAMTFDRDNSDEQTPTGAQPSQLKQWPVQFHLVSPVAPYFQGADVLLAADCVAFSMGDFHSNHLRGKALAIACPKLDQGTEVYIQKLTAMIDQAKINTLTVMIMEVPCCAGLIQMARTAADNATRKVPIKKMVIGLKGEILSEDWV